MFSDVLVRPRPHFIHTLNFTPAWCLAVLLGVVMPVLSAILYPTYMHKMPSPVHEWTRLQEIPFVLSEVAIIFWALRRGMELRQFTSKLPRDCLIALGAFIVGLWGSTLLVSFVPMTSMVISMSFIIHLMFGCAVYHLTGGAKQQVIDQLAAGLGLGLAVLALVTAWRFALPPPASSVMEGKIEWHAAVPGFISVRHFGSWTGAITAIFAAIILRRRDDAHFSWHDLAYLLAAGLTIWSGTRAAVLAIALASAFVVIGSGKIPSLRVIGRLSILTGIAASLAFLLIPYGDANFYLFAPEDSLRDASELGGGRWQLWVATFSKWLESPWFGWGSGSTFWEVRIGWPHTQPHNFVLQFLLSWGLVGACSAIWLLGRTVVEAHRRTLAHPELWPLLAGLYALLMMACVEGMLHYPRFIMLIAALLAIIFRLGSPDRTAVS